MATSSSPPRTSTLVPSEVLVEVLNGTGASGQAGQAAAALHAEGFALNGTANASNFAYRVTVVAYPPGDEPAAQLLAAHVIGETALRPDDQLPAGVVDLVLGASYGGVRS